MLLAFVLAVSMFPQIAIVSPLYLLLRTLGLINTYPGLVLPYLTFAMPLTIWLLTGFFRQLPAALEEAGMIDGAGWTRILRDIVLPLSWPGVATTAILTFLYSWNEFLFALVLSGPDTQTLPVGLAGLETHAGVEIAPLAAATVVSLLPVFLLLPFLRKHLIKGLSLGALK